MDEWVYFDGQFQNFFFLNCEGGSVFRPTLLGAIPINPCLLKYVAALYAYFQKWAHLFSHTERLFYAR